MKRVIYLCVVAIATAGITWNLSQAKVSDGGTVSVEMSEAEAAVYGAPQYQCCRVCSVGYACGNSCISRAKQCHKPKGCACDAQ